MENMEKPVPDFEDYRNLSEDATAQQRINDIVERATERGSPLTKEERDEINQLKSHREVDELIEKAIRNRPDGTEEF
ncbi:MAG TPA: hypothetical protein VLB02_00850 [Candidatus Paceibacterota bacterium]|nr:hypothetical protein [Candidatus Paceibacterota bacterium]